MEVKAYANVTPPSTWNSEAEVLSTYRPALTVKLQDNKDTNTTWLADETCNSNSDVSNVCFDIHPGSAYAYGSSAADMSDASGVENIDLHADNVAETTDICTEKWQISPTAVACVEMKVKLSRKRNTGDTAHDIILDLSNTYTMHAMVGRVADKADETLKFETIDVDFTQFSASGAIATATYSASALAAIIYSMAF